MRDSVTSAAVSARRRRKDVASRTHPAGISGAGAGFRLRVIMHVIIITRDRERGYALRRKSAALTRVRNCSGVSGSEVGAGAGFTAAGAGGFAAFFAALRAASFASCLVARSFASAPTGSAGAPSTAMRWQSTAGGGRVTSWRQRSGFGQSCVLRSVRR